MSTSAPRPIPFPSGTRQQQRALQQQLDIKRRYQKMADNEARIWKDSLGDAAYASDHTELIEVIAYEIHFKESLDLDTAIVLAWEMIG